VSTAIHWSGPVLVGAALTLGLTIVLISREPVIGPVARASAPGWVGIGSLGWIGSYVLYTVWAFWFGRSLLRLSQQ
jgi:hypothetical protein